jgi:NADH-quinone oxidoreductase subunit L
LLTSFYSWRLIFLTFFGKARWIQSEHIQHALHDHVPMRTRTIPPPRMRGTTRPHEASAQDLKEGTGGYHPHESPWTMLVPLGVLSSARCSPASSSTTRSSKWRRARASGAPASISTRT